MSYTPLDHPEPITGCMLRYALLHTLPDGQVARWLLDGMPSIEDADQIPGSGATTALQRAIFSSPIVCLSPETIHRAVSSRTSRADAELMGMLLHLATTGRAVPIAMKLSRELSQGASYTSTEHGYPETVSTSLHVPASPTIGYLARNWRGPVTLRELRAVDGLDRLEHMVWDRWAGDYPIPGPLHRVMTRLAALVPVLWRTLGDDPGAWSLALELMGSPEMTMGDALQAAVAASSAEGSRTRLKARRTWRRAPLVNLTYEGGELAGLHNPRSLRLEPLRR